jgi:hypothetical protein
MAQTVEYVYDPNTKTYVIVPEKRWYLGPGAEKALAGINNKGFKESFTASQIAEMGEKSFTKDGKVTVQVPMGKALLPEKAKEFRAKRDSSKPVEVDPISLKPIEKVKKTKSVLGDSTSFIEYGDYEWNYNSEQQLVTPKSKDKDGKDVKDLPLSGLLLNALDPKTNQMKLTVTDTENFTRGLRKQFIKTPDEIVRYKQLLKDARWYDGPIDNRPDPAFFNILRQVAGELTDWNYYSSTIDNGPVYDLPGYLEAMAAGGGGGLTRTTTTLSTENELYGALNQQFEKYTGRRVPDNVLDEFVQRVNAQERQSPQVQTTTGEDSVISGGASGIAEREAVQFAREQKGAGAYRGATYYLDALMGYVNRGTPGA